MPDSVQRSHGSTIFVITWPIQSGLAWPDSDYEVLTIETYFNLSRALRLQVVLLMSKQDIAHGVQLSGRGEREITDVD